MPDETVLVVDDHQENVDFLKNYILRPMGLKTIWGFDGQRGLEIALEHHPDLILLDMSMPRMSGMEMLKALRTRDFQAPVIFMTMYGSENIAVEVFRLGVRDYLSKPFTVDEVQDAVNRSLRETRLAQEKEALARNLIAAETIRKTVVTLAHHINNHLTVVGSGLLMTQEELQRIRLVDSTILSTIKESLSSAKRIGDVIRVLKRVTEVKNAEYYGDLKMIDIENALRHDLNQSQSA